MKKKVPSIIENSLNSDKKEITDKSKSKYNLHNKKYSHDKDFKNLSFDESHRTSKSNSLKEILEAKKTDIKTGRKFVLNISNMKQTNISPNYWGSKFKQNF